jgi:hypothetical protein
VKPLRRVIVVLVVVGATLTGSVSSSEADVHVGRVFPTDGQFLGVSAASSSNAWAVGTYWNPGVGSLPLIGHWTGNTWSNVTAPYPKHSFDDSLYAVGDLSPTDAWAVGTYEYPDDTDQPLAEHWNGNAWTIDNPLIPVGSTDVEILAVSVVSAHDVWIAGHYEGDNFTEYTVAERWNGHRWSIAKTIDPSLKYDQNYSYGISALPDGTEWTVGTWDSAKNGYESLVEEANGRTWRQVPSPNSPNGYESILNAVEAHSVDSAWAAGYYAVTNAVGFPLTEHWDGKRWSIVAISAPANATNADLTSVSTYGKKEAITLGYYQEGAPASAYFPLAEVWDGTRWSQSIPLVPARSTSTDLTSIALSGKYSAWAVGGCSCTQNEPLIEQWNGKSWTISAT